MRLFLFLLISSISIGSASAQKLVHDRDLRGHAGAVALDAKARTVTYMWGLDELRQIDLSSAHGSTLHSFKRCCDVGNHSNILVGPSEAWLAAAVNDTLVVVDASSGRVRSSFVVPGAFGSAIRRLTGSPGGDRIAAGGSFWGFALWDLRTERLNQVGVGDSMVSESVAWSPRGDLVAIGGFDRARRVLVYDLDRRGNPRVFKGAPSYVKEVAFSPRGDLLLAGSGGNVVLAWDVATGRERWRTPAPDSIGGYSLSFSPDGRFVLSEKRNGDLVLLELATGRQVLSWRAHDRPGGVMDAAFSPGRPFVVSSGYDARLRVWDLTEAIGKLAE